MADDGYEAWYAERLWSLLPAIYRVMDGEIGDLSDPLDPLSRRIGPLEKLVERIGAQAAIVRRGIDRLSDNSFIETSDDWAIPYLGDLLATRTVSCLDARAQRLDVAYTIHYRRRAGTVSLLEQLARDISGHDARVVEFFRRMGRTRHQFDPAIGLVPRISHAADPDAPAVIEALAGAQTRTPAGGFADLRNTYGATRAHTAFDEFAHAADFRRGRQTTGWHNIPRLGVFLWRLHAYEISGATPVRKTGCPSQFSFDPTGRDIPLFAPPQPPLDRLADDWIAAPEWKLPVPVDRWLWGVKPAELYPEAFNVGLVAGGTSVPAALAGLWIDPEIGRFIFTGGAPAGTLDSNYRFGFSAPVGAGGFDPRIMTKLETPATPPAQVAVSNGAGLPTNVAADTEFEITDSVTYPNPGDLAVSAAAIIRAAPDRRPLLRWSPRAAWTINGAPGATLVLQGMHLQGADIRLTGAFDSVRLRMVTIDPGSSGAADAPPTLFRDAVDGLSLAPCRLLVEGQVGELILDRCIVGPIRTIGAGTIAELRIADSIVQSIPTREPGDPPVELVDAAYLATVIQASTNPQVAALIAAQTNAVQTALGAYVYPAAPNATLRNALTALATGASGPQLAGLFPPALADLALSLTGGDTHLVRTTVLGPTWTHRLAASECVLDDVARVEDAQRGCVRFSVYAEGSNLHAPYRCLKVPAACSLFDSRVFGRPEYGRIRGSADHFIIVPGPHDSIHGCAEDGAEPGAFHSERVTLKRRGVGQKYLEYMPIGVTPVWIDAD